MEKINIYGQLYNATTRGIIAEANQVTTENGKTVEERLNEPSLNDNLCGVVPFNGKCTIPEGITPQDRMIEGSFCVDYYQAQKRFYARPGDKPAATALYTKWPGCERWQRENGKPIPGTVYRSYSGNMYYCSFTTGELVDLPIVFSALTNKPTTLSGYGITNAYTKTEVQQQIANAHGDYYTKSEIDGKVSSVYKPAGSINATDIIAASDIALPAIQAQERTLGNVYNVKQAFTTTDNFVEGAGKSYPAGTNIVCVAVTELTAQGQAPTVSYKWDVLAGFVDLSACVKTTDLQYATDEDIDAMFDEVFNNN